VIVRAMIRRTILSVALVLAGGEAIAQRRPRGQQQGTGLTGEADERFRRGISLAGENNYSAALIEFRRAYDVSRNALILFNVAAMEIELGHFAEGLDAINEYERSAPAPVVQARRAQIDALQTRIRERSGTVTVALSHPGLRVQVDAIGASGVRVVREGPAASAAIRLPIGRYRVTLSATGFRQRESEHDIAANSDTRVDAALEAARAALTIRASVEAAEVKIDGRSVGFTPLSQQEVTEGEHRIEVSRPGYTSFARTVTAQGNLGVIEATLQWAPSISAEQAGHMALDRAYSDVECTLDGQRVDCGGSDSVPPGPHVLRVTGRDYLPAEQTVRLDAGRVTRVELLLTARPEAIRESQERGTSQRRIGFIVGGVGLAMGIGGGVWLPLAIGEMNQSQEVKRDLGTCRRPLLLERWDLMCVNDMIEPLGLQPVTNAMEADGEGRIVDEEADADVLRVGFAGAILGLGVIGITTGAILIATAPADRFSTPPPRRARLAPQFSPTLNGFALRF
jgi:tetratricopeptide (TPR) repeat protein